MEENDHVYHITVSGMNPHDLANEMGQEGSPFYDQHIKPSVAQHIISDVSIVGGIVDVWAGEQLTSEQEQYLHNIPYVIDIRHVYPE